MHNGIKIFISLRKWCSRNLVQIGLPFILVISNYEKPFQIIFINENRSITKKLKFREKLKKILERTFLSGALIRSDLINS